MMRRSRKRSSARLSIFHVIFVNQFLPIDQFPEVLVGVIAQGFHRLSHGDDVLLHRGLRLLHFGLRLLHRGLRLLHFGLRLLHRGLRLLHRGLVIHELVDFGQQLLVEGAGCIQPRQDDFFHCSLGFPVTGWPSARDRRRSSVAVLCRHLSCTVSFSEDETHGGFYRIHAGSAMACSCACPQICDDGRSFLIFASIHFQEIEPMLLNRIFIAGVLLFAAACSAGCSAKEETPSGPVWKPAGNEGTITGLVAFAGEPPAPRKLDTASDSNCGEVLLDDVMTADGKLQNVFVYVKSGLPQVAFETPAAEATLDQKGCKFTPRIVGVQTGQIVRITNSDPTNHNVHPIPKLNKEWNESQLAGQGPIRRKFTRQETLIPVKCNQHAWMTAFIGVVAHPFFAVSDAGGAFAIRGLPPGEYELEAWHEKFGAKTLAVKVEANAEAKAYFRFDPATAYAPGALTRQPALVIP
jgi:plastocyanin